MSPHDLTLVGLSKTYGASVAVDSIDLEVAAGHIVSLLGPSGCGKTTTLRMVAGLIQPSAGEICFMGKPVTDVPVHRRGVGMLFQNYALFPHMTVAGNVSFGLEMRSKDRKRNRASVERALEMVQLSTMAQRYPHQLSGGQQQRVALARALVIEPSVLLLDEPFGALDKKLREEMQLQLQDIQRRLKVTTIMVTHDQDEALTISDRIAVMNKGRIEQYGTPSDIYERPASRFVAQFIGASNLLEGAIVERRGAEALVRTASGIGLTVAAPPAGDRVMLSLRPELIALSAAPGADEAPNDAARGIVERSIYRGVATEIHLRLDSGEALLVRCPNGSATAGLAAGAAVQASWPGRAAWALPEAAIGLAA